jgi:Ca-activated chloride channel homolog
MKRPRAMLACVVEEPRPASGDTLFSVPPAPHSADQTEQHELELDALAALDRIPAADGATAIGDALTLAAQQLPARGHRAVVLMTDGVNNRGEDPLQAANALATRHIPIYTVGIGTQNSGMLIPGTAEPAQLDEDALRAIAQAGGGAYAKASDAEGLKTALAHLGSSTTFERRRIDASLPFALGGGVLLLATILTSLAAGRFP